MEGLTVMLELSVITYHIIFMFSNTQSRYKLVSSRSKQPMRQFNKQSQARSAPSAVVYIVEPLVLAHIVLILICTSNYDQIKFDTS